MGLALLIAATAAPVAAHPGPGPGTPTPSPAATGLPAEKDPGTTAGSVHWLHAQEHELDVVAFEPGEVVRVPFKPREDDTWKIDGSAPKALPAGHATGRQMRDAPQGSVWAAGKPGKSDSAPGNADPTTGDAAGLDETIDQPITEPGSVADPASVSVSGAGAETADAAAIGSDGLRREVFGFLPYWELSDSSTVLDWRVLSTVAYFSVGCRSNGDLAKRNNDGSLTTGWAGWTSSRMTSVINAAHSNQSRVVLTVSCFAWSGSGAQTQAQLLGSATARANLAKQVAAAVRDRGADGVNLDFEPIVSGYADEFTLLVRRVRTELNNIAAGYQLTFDTTGHIGNQPIADATAPGGADAVFIMGYDYRTAGSSTAGSIAPLTGPAYDLTDTVRAYAAKVSPSKIILGVPWYGRAWSTATDTVRASTLNPAKYGASAVPLYAQAMDFLAANGRRWDSVEQSAWTAYRRQTCTSTYGCVTSWRQLYVDDATSIKLRYDLVNREQLRGVGIWALGYDDARTEMRTALADKFLRDRTSPVTGIETLASSQRDERFRVSWAGWDDGSIKSYDVDVVTAGGAWTRWITGTEATSALFDGSDGKTYGFRVRGTDGQGNVSTWKVTSVSGLGVPGELAVGGFATVRVDGLRLRTAASTGAAIMTTLDAGDTMRVIGGPATGNGYTWFQVTGPIDQWPTVDQPQVGGWIAAFGNGVENAAARRAPYATRVDAGITGLRLASGGERVLTPDGDGKQDVLRVAWTNELALDSLSLRIVRSDGSVVGSVSLDATATGAQAVAWNGRIGGELVPNGVYVIQLRGQRGSATYHAPSASPASQDQFAQFGVIVAAASPTAVHSFSSSPASPTRSGSLTFKLQFGGAIRGLTAGDLARGGTARDCVVGAPLGSGATWSVPVTGCSAGSVTLAVRARSVADAVGNLGPAANVAAPKVVIDRSSPIAAKPRVGLVAGTELKSGSTSAALAVKVSWSAWDPGGAGIRDYDVRRSVDGGPWRDVVVDGTRTSIVQSLVPGHTYRYLVRARDRAGNVGAWVAGATFPVVLRQNESPTLRYAGTWRLSAATAFSGGSARYSTAAGASVRYSMSGRSIALILTRGPNRGVARVYVDGVLAATIDSRAATLQTRWVAWSRTWATTGTHTIRIVVAGTTGRSRVDVDAIAVLR